MINKKLRLAILKEISNGNLPLSENDFHVSADDFDESVNFLIREGYLKGVYHADDRPQLDAIGPVVTEKGERYLQESKTVVRTYRGLKEIRDWFKL